MSLFLNLKSEGVVRGMARSLGRAIRDELDASALQYVSFPFSGLCKAKVGVGAFALSYGFCNRGRRIDAHVILVSPFGPAFR